MVGTPGHRELTAQEAAFIAELKAQGAEALVAMDALTEALGRGGREFAIAKTKFEEAVMWAVKGITG
jgi:hypothetical protein